MDYKFREDSIRRIKKLSPGAGKRLIWLAEQYIEECLKCVSEADGQITETNDSLTDDNVTTVRSYCRTMGRKRYYSKYGGLRNIKRCETDEERFPNVAGFCRFMGISLRKYAEICNLYPEETGQIQAAFEDEALNSGKPAALTCAYLKARLGYAEPEAPGKSEGDGEVKVIFEHDVLSDGG